MQNYHKAWLLAHPRRSEAWLAARLADGFHVHHWDGDPTNNKPDNLVLLDGIDHQRIHGARFKTLNNKPLDMSLGAISYHARADYKQHWYDIAQKLGVSVYSVSRHAMLYAERMGHPWPLPRLPKPGKRPYQRPVYRGY